jgi:hypothetical protein
MTVSAVEFAGSLRLIDNFFHAHPQHSFMPFGIEQRYDDFGSGTHNDSLKWGLESEALNFAHRMLHEN